MPDGIADAVSPADQQHQGFGAAVHALLELPGPLDGVKLFASFIEQDEVVVGLQFFEDQFFFQLFGPRGIGGGCFFGKLQENQFDVVVGFFFLEVVADAFVYEGFILFADASDLDMHDGAAKVRRVGEAAKFW